MAANVGLVPLDGWRDITPRQIAAEQKRDCYRNLATIVFLVGAVIAIALSVGVAKNQLAQTLTSSTGVLLGFAGVCIFMHFRTSYERDGLRGFHFTVYRQQYIDLLKTCSLNDMMIQADRIGLVPFIQNGLLTPEEATRVRDFLDDAVNLIGYNEGKTALWYQDEWKKIQAELRINGSQ